MSTPAPNSHTPACSPSIDPAPLLPSLAASDLIGGNGAIDTPDAEPPLSSPSPRPSSAPAVPADVKEQEIIITLEDRRYRIRGMDRNLGFDSMKVNLLAVRGEALHVDTLDLYGARVAQAVHQRSGAGTMHRGKDAQARPGQSAAQAGGIAGAADRRSHQAQGQAHDHR